MSTQSTQQQQPSFSEAPGPGGEIMAGKVGEGTEGVALGLGQGLYPQTASKAQSKKQRKLAKEKHQPQQSTQHYQQRSASQEYRKEPSPITEGISQESSVQQAGQSIQETEKKRENLPLAQKPKESPILPMSQTMEVTPASTIGSKSSMEPPLLSPDEKDRQLQARKEVERLEEKERQERIDRSKQEDLPSVARKQAELVQQATGAKGAEQKKSTRLERKDSTRVEQKESTRVPKYVSEEEKEIMVKRAADSEASLIGTVIDEEQERQRRIKEEYEVDTQPMEKTKAMEEIERSRRIHSYAEKDRQKLASKWSSILFPNAPRAHFAESKLWTPSGLLRRGSDLPSGQKTRLTSGEPRYGQFVATTTKTTSTHLPSIISTSKQSTYPSTQITASSREGVSKTHVVESGAIVDFTVQQTGLSASKVCPDTYRSQNRPRIVVHHSGLTGKWARATETVELKEGVDY